MPGQPQLPTQVSGLPSLDVFQAETEFRGGRAGFDAQGSEQAIPERKDVSVVAVGFDPGGRMMQAMQARRDQQ